MPEFMADPSVQGAFFPHAVFFQLGHYMIGYYLAFIRYIKYMTLFNCGIIYGRVWAASHLYLNTRPQDFAIILG